MNYLYDRDRAKLDKMWMPADRHILSFGILGACYDRSIMIRSKSWLLLLEGQKLSTHKSQSNDLKLLKNISVLKDLVIKRVQKRTSVRLEPSPEKFRDFSFVTVRPRPAVC